MDETGKKLLNLMFRPEETVCVSPNKYGYHSVPLSNVINDQELNLLSTKFRDGVPLEEALEKYKTEELLLVSLNPINGWRADLDVTAHRNFLVEMDYGPLPEQMAYAKKIELPYSAVVFSGSKSLHFLISLEENLESYEQYYEMAEWTLGIATAADQMTKNPSRSIRIPGAYREPGKKQRLVEIKPAISIAQFQAWLDMYPGAKPVKPERREISETMDFSKMKGWVSKKLVEGIHADRNKWWFAIACECALAGYDYDDTIDKLGAFFTPDRDFREREWKVTIKSAFRHIYERKQ